MFQEPAFYRDREAAGRALARSLMNTPYAMEDPVVMSIPRSGVPLAGVVAEELDCDLDICLVRRIVSPTDPNKTIAAVTENGDIHLTDRSSWGWCRKYIEEVRARELADIRQRRLFYNTPAISIRRRTVILIDDGVATGSTILAAIHTLRKQNPAKIVVATPFASREAVDKICKKKVAEMIALYVPPTFNVLAQHYLDFTSITDTQVKECLQFNRNRIRTSITRERLPRPSISTVTSASSDSSSDSSDVEEKHDFEEDNVVDAATTRDIPPWKMLPKHIVFRARKHSHASNRTLEILRDGGTPPPPSSSNTVKGSSSTVDIKKKGDQVAVMDQLQIMA